MESKGSEHRKRRRRKTKAGSVKVALRLGQKSTGRNRGFPDVPWRKRAFGSGTKYGF